MNSDEVKIGEKIIETIKTRGEVLDTSKQDVTHVEGGGGGGSGAKVDPIYINSYTTTSHEFWIKGEDGIEQSYNLQDSNLPLRTGHIISIFLIRLKGSEARYPVFVVNHTLGTWHYISNGETLEYIVGKKYIGKYLVLLPFPISWITIPGSDAGVAVVCVTLAFLWLIYGLFFNWIVYFRNRKLANQMFEHLKDMAKTILRDG